MTVTKAQGRRGGQRGNDEGKMGRDIKPEGAKNPADYFPPLLTLNIYWCL